MKLFLSCLTLCAVLLSSHGHASEVDVELLFSNEQPAIGDTITARLTLSISNLRRSIPNQTPEFPTIPGLRIQSLNNVQQQYYATPSGHFAKISWGYALTPTTTGPITIPSFEITLDSFSAKTPAKLLVVKPGPHGETKLVPRIIAAVDERNIPADESTSLRLIFRNTAAPDTAPELPPMTGVVAGSPKRIREIASDTWMWPIFPTRTGVTSIPSISVDVQGTTLQSDPITLNISKPRFVFAKAHVEKNELFVGEPVRVSWSMTFAHGAQFHQIIIPWIHEMTDWVVRPVDNVPNNKYADVNIDDVPTRFIIEKSSDRITLTLERILIPWRVGTYTLASGGCVVRRVFDQYIAHSEPITLTVRELPQEGRPQHIDIPIPVGQFQIKAEIHPSELAVGETCELVRTITGQGNLEMINLDPLTDSDDFSVYEHTSTITINPDGLSGTKVFRQAISPRNNQATTFPATSFSWFDPIIGQYQTVTTPTIPITVHPSANNASMTSADTDLAQEPSLRNHAKAQKVGADVGNIMLEGLHTKTRPSPYKQGVFWALFTLTTAIMLMGSWLGRKRSAMLQEEYRRIRTAKAQAEATLQKAQTALEHHAAHEAFLTAASAMRQYLADKTLRPDGEITQEDIQNIAVTYHMPETIFSALSTLLTTADAGRFGGGATEASAQEFMTRCTTLLPELEKLSWSESV